MPIRTVAPRLIQPGAVRRSAALSIPNIRGSRNVDVLMTDTGDWFSGLTGNVIRWGLMTSLDGGNTWEWGPRYSEGTPFGRPRKDGSLQLPTIGITWERDTFEQNAMVCLGIEVDTAVTLGAVVTIT